MKPPKHIAIREWRSINAEQHGLTPNAVARVLAAATREARRLGLAGGAVLSRTDNGFKAGQVVGILTVPGVTVEILPKVDAGDGAVRAALMHMLAVAKGIKVTSGDLTAMGTQRHYLLETLIGLFARRLLAAVRRGLPRRYIRHEEDLPILRGSLNVKRQFTALVVRPDRIASRFDELSEDTPLNRVCKAAVTRLAGVTRVLANHRLLMELRARLDNVTDSASPLDEPVALDRTNAAFHDVHRLATLFLKGDWQDVTSGRASGFALLFPMNDLFEEFIGRSLQAALGRSRVKLQAQRGMLGPMRHPNATAPPLAGGGTYWMRPDIVVWPDTNAIGVPGHSTRPAVLDTKWKRLDRGGPSSADVQQMLLYGQAYQASRVVLVYPWHERLGREGVHYRWSVTGTDYEVEAATVDVGKPDNAQATLRALFK